METKGQGGAVHYSIILTILQFNKFNSAARLYLDYQIFDEI